MPIDMAVQYMRTIENNDENASTAAAAASSWNSTFDRRIIVVSHCAEDIMWSARFIQ